MIKYSSGVRLVILLLSTYSVSGQATNRLNLLQKKKLVHRIEAFAGTGLNFPNNKGWDDYIMNSSNGHTTYKSERKSGYILGVGIAHSAKKYLEIQGRFSLERKEYLERYTTSDNNGDLYSKTSTDQKNDYLAFSLIPNFFFLESSRLHLFAGLSYLYLTKSVAFGDNYINGQYTGSASVNTIDGFERHIVEALVGVGYLVPVRDKFGCIIRVQGNYGISNSIKQNDYKLSINSLSMALAIQYNR